VLIQVTVFDKDRKTANSIKLKSYFKLIWPSWNNPLKLFTFRANLQTHKNMKTCYDYENIWQEIQNTTP
jgi:hypothetical protein